MKSNDAAVGIIFANTHDNLLGEMTSVRSIGSLPFGGRYRLIDFALSNMVNANISTVGIITKSNYQSLMDHLGAGKPWDLARKLGGLKILPPYGMSSDNGHSGDIDALYNILGFLERNQSDIAVLCEADVVSNIDINAIIEQHKAQSADITMAYKREIMPPQTKDYITYRIEETGRIFDIQVEPQATATACCHGITLYVCNKDFLIKIIKDAYSRNKKSFVKDVFLELIARNRFMGYEIKGFTPNINSVKSYLEANMALLNKDVRDDLFNFKRPIYTKIRDDMPAIYGLNSLVKNSLIADGCVINGTVENSVIFRGVTVDEGTVVKDCVLMTNTKIAKKVNLSYVITDKDVIINDSRNLIGFESYPVYISKGSVV